MNKKLVLTIMAILGVGAVAGGAYYIYKNKKFRKDDADISDDAEIEPVVFDEETEDPREEARKALNKPEITELLKNIYSGYEYKDYTSSSEPVETPTDEPVSGRFEFGEKPTTPYIIDEEYFEVTRDNDHDYVELTLYSDGVITDERDNKIRNVDDILGKNNIDYMNQENLDAVYIRNENTSTDYLVARDLRRYIDVIAEYEYDEEG